MSQTIEKLALRIFELEAENERIREQARLHQQLERAAKELPLSWSITIDVEEGSGTVLLHDTQGMADSCWDESQEIAAQVSDAIDAAIEMERCDNA